MLYSSAWTKVFEWWAGQSLAIRYGVALSLLAVTALIWVMTGKISLWFLATGLVLLVAAAVIRD